MSDYTEAFGGLFHGKPLRFANTMDGNGYNTAL